jgi:hypothetical protein
MKNHTLFSGIIGTQLTIIHPHVEGYWLADGAQLIAS